MHCVSENLFMKVFGLFFILLFGNFLGDSTTSKDVAKTLRSSYQATIGKNKGLRLEAPASSVQEAKIGRLATHKKFTQQMTKWDAAVHSRRAATQVSYPLVKPDLRYLQTFPPFL